jgi:hypothetical protein
MQEEWWIENADGSRSVVYKSKENALAAIVELQLPSASLINPRYSKPIRLVSSDGTVIILKDPAPRPAVPRGRDPSV